MGFLLMMGGGADSPEHLIMTFLVFADYVSAHRGVIRFRFRFLGYYAETQNEGGGEKLNINVIEY